MLDAVKGHSDMETAARKMRFGGKPKETGKHLTTANTTPARLSQFLNKASRREGVDFFRPNDRLEPRRHFTIEPADACFALASRSAAGV